MTTMARAASEDRLMRRLLWASVPLNAAAALAFAFPASLGRIADLPVSVPPVYGGLVAFFVALFGGAYAWLALQPAIDRPLVALAAIGKAGVFVLVLALWLAGAASGRFVLLMTADLVLAALFARWLLVTRA